MKTTYTLPQLHAQTKSNRDKDKMDILLTRDVLPSAVNGRTAGESDPRPTGLSR